MTRVPLTSLRTEPEAIRPRWFAGGFSPPPSRLLVSPSPVEVSGDSAEAALLRAGGSPVVYFLSDELPGARPLLKVGYSAHPARRLMRIRSHNPRARLVALVPGGTRALEAALHSALSMARMSVGEWFDVSFAGSEFVEPWREALATLALPDAVDYEPFWQSVPVLTVPE